jgi:cob(I)alamin adenosyltransferase
MVILDEFTYPLHYGWVSTEEVIEVLKQRPPMQHVIITGRHAPQALIDCADLVTEMRVVKHPYQQGIKAQPGVEF